MLLFGKDPRITTRSFDLEYFGSSIKGSAIKNIDSIDVRFRITYNRKKSEFILMKIKEINIDSDELSKIISSEYPEYFL